MPIADAEIRRLYAQNTMIGRPWVRTNFVATLDGAVAAEDGLSGAMGGAVDTRVFEILRHLSDVILVGAGTARTEGYGPTNRPIAVVSRSLNLPERLVVPGTILITTSDAPAAELARLRKIVDVIAVGEGQIDWAVVMRELAREGLRNVLCEGGPTLHGELIGLDLIDEVCLTIAPVLAAGPAGRIAHSPLAADRPMTLKHAIDVDGVLLTRWLRKRT